jgi:hypothetical protein
VRLVALLSWFDEPVELLTLALDGARRAGCSAVVAVDGRYEHFPSNGDVSAAEQRAVIDAACRHHGMDLTLHVAGPWDGEPSKRTQLFGLALAVSDPGDWWLILDADTIVTDVQDEFLFALAAVEDDAALVRVVDVEARRAKRPDWPVEVDFRLLYRAQPMAVIGTHHYDYTRLSDGQPLWRGGSGADEADGVVPATNLAEYMTVEHRPAARDPGRLFQKMQSYTARDESGKEMGQCARCDKQAQHRVYADPRMQDGHVVASIVEVCTDCARKAKYWRQKWLAQHHLPTDMAFYERYSAPSRDEHDMAAAMRRAAQ